MKRFKSIQEKFPALHLLITWKRDKYLDDYNFLDELSGTDVQGCLQEHRADSLIKVGG